MCYEDGTPMMQGYVRMYSKGGKTLGRIRSSRIKRTNSISNSPSPFQPLEDVADEIGVHESTVSRVTSNKYVETPRGTFELKYFFDSSVRQSGGDDVAAEAVKHHIRALIQQEPNAKPLSDDKLADLLLAKFNIEVARRTVAKYREALRIAPTNLRKTL